MIVALQPPGAHRRRAPPAVGTRSQGDRSEEHGDRWIFLPIALTGSGCKAKHRKRARGRPTVLSVTW